MSIISDYYGQRTIISLYNKINCEIDKTIQVFIF